MKVAWTFDKMNDGGLAVFCTLWVFLLISKFFFVLGAVDSVEYGPESFMHCGRWARSRA